MAVGIASIRHRLQAALYSARVLSLDASPTQLELGERFEAGDGGGGGLLVHQRLVVRSGGGGVGQRGVRRSSNVSWQS